MPDALLDAAGAIVGGDAVRAGSESDSIEGTIPRVVVEPATDAMVGAILEWASQERLAVIARGSGTKLTWGAPPQRADVVLSTRRLNAVLAHRHGDLTATVQAGATLRDVNRTLAQHRQWIPLDPPFADRATIGGLVATNDSGPRRHRYGSPRDLIIGIEFARSNGQLAKGGGIVVKNVAGYDLPRLLTGSFGSLGVIVTATFKLYPLTAASRTLVAEVATPADIARLAGKLAASHLTPTALEFATHPFRVILRFESIEASVDRQSESAAALMQEGGGSVATFDGSGEDQLWLEQARFADDARGALVRVSTLPTQLGETLNLIEKLAGSGNYAATGRAGAGVFLLRVLGDSALQQRVVTGLRDSFPAGRGSAVIVRAPRDIRSHVDVWGPIGDGLRVMQSVKQQFDPAGVLSPGRGPGNI